MYKVIQSLMVKVQGTIKTFPVGSIVKLPEKAAQIFIQQGKIEPVTAGYELAERMAIMGENTEPMQRQPFVTESGVLVIPFNSDRRFHYWKPGGQSVCVTLRELGRCDLIQRYKSTYN
ncbi:MAG: hypothetical protein DYG83_11350 [Candidatus Brocadia sp. AMX2]|uniref:Uncharacterized protein n=1 Tax=Candidatus Brocadia sinica JPN1 TaxID=1197129 RepID=A0ABQ0JS60_9BACT|nr:MULTISPECIES: hypothetical protein [Brocadia]MBC6933095.1 hypothetical protein [Candidatus Brocadia sp.]MBL1168426.1 hypothetical protein [Candidatus Brocadia sp. AMX1]NOG43166.1 hypothetical protein [Planctomycetota bacterium]GIK12399.1 MAG: hypothetical protein BroJett002_11060 [Candidatus Brocadia sinica]KAA0242824.1 MAG: hypothetical protein EDM70_12650 [Candidatus Brocadia sp. AMX2]